MRETLARVDLAVTLLFLVVLFVAAFMKKKNRLRPYAWLLATVLSFVVFGLDAVLAIGVFRLAWDSVILVFLIFCTYKAFKERI